MWKEHTNRVLRRFQLFVWLRFAFYFSHELNIFINLFVWFSSENFSFFFCNLLINRANRVIIAEEWKKQRYLEQPLQSVAYTVYKQHEHKKRASFEYFCSKRKNFVQWLFSVFGATQVSELKSCNNNSEKYSTKVLKPYNEYSNRQKVAMKICFFVLFIHEKSNFSFRTKK